MEYVPPYTSVDPDAPYINGNPATGTKGSIPPAAAFEHPMREIVHAIEQAGLTPDGDDLTQLWQAIAGTDMLGVNGYWSAPGGWILQMGHASLATGDGDVVTLPIAFPTAIYSVIASDFGSGAKSTGWATNGASLSTIKGYGRDISTGGYEQTAFGYLAIGR